MLRNQPRRKTCLILLFLFIGIIESPAAEPFWKEQNTGTKAGLRGLAIASKSASASTTPREHPSEASRHCLWASGGKGTVLRSLDAGRTWVHCGPTPHADLEFRSIHAWDDTRACIASAGTPAIVLLTHDAGRTWQETYRDPRSEAFIDGLLFIDARRGILFGDPYDGHFAIASTLDAGRTWKAHGIAQSPPALPGEAAFAASNSAMLVDAAGNIWIGTGGSTNKQARVHRAHDFGLNWHVATVELPSNASSGIFSLARSPSGILVAVGGDYRPDSPASGMSARSLDQGRTFTLAKVPPAGFRSAVVYSTGTPELAAGFYATGPGGTDYSADGASWQPISSIGFHALATTVEGRLFAVGADGRFGWTN